ncbi:hypothetical protein V5T82_14125 [Magnetovibrio sp. PR-2]|uniref:hypothetical protein n=1 Tax=Magnetovibrio sp. PR-2 TaxID=3120356 RepID=UPI002FCE4FF0
MAIKRSSTVIKKPTKSYAKKKDPKESIVEGLEEQAKAYQTLVVEGKTEAFTMRGSKTVKVTPRWFEAGGKFVFNVHYGIRGIASITMDELSEVPEAIQMAISDVQKGKHDDTIEAVQKEMAAARAARK